jgi:hypothetical protein
LKYKQSIDKNQNPAHTQKTKIKWDRAIKDKYVELVNEGIQSSDLTLETAKDVEKAFLNLNSVINNAASAITPKPTIRRNKPKLQVMSEEILKAIKNIYIFVLYCPIPFNFCLLSMCRVLILIY